MAWDPQTQTLAIAGTKTFGDVMVDATIPFGNLLQHTKRYQDALTEFRKRSPARVIGHSLGGELASRISKEHPEANTQFLLFGTPRIQYVEDDPRVTSYKHVGDPIAMFDQAAHQTLRLGNPHSYRGFNPY